MSKKKSLLSPSHGFCRRRHARLSSQLASTSGFFSHMREARYDPELARSCRNLDIRDTDHAPPAAPRTQDPRVHLEELLSRGLSPRAFAALSFPTGPAWEFSDELPNRDREGRSGQPLQNRGVLCRSQGRWPGIRVHGSTSGSGASPAGGVHPLEKIESIFSAAGPPWQSPAHEHGVSVAGPVWPSTSPPQLVCLDDFLVGLGAAARPAMEDSLHTAACPLDLEWAADYA